MKNILIALSIILIVFSACEETIWPEVQQINNSEYLGVWNTQSFRAKYTYFRTQDTKTFNYAFRDTSYTDSTQMTFEFGVSKLSGVVVEDSVKITSIQTVNGVVKAPVIKTGYFTISQTEGSDYSGKVTYINIWEKASNMHSAISDPYTTYTVTNKTNTEIELSWAGYNNTAQNTVKYMVFLTK